MTTEISRGRLAAAGAWDGVGFHTRTLSWDKEKWRGMLGVRIVSFRISSIQIRFLIPAASQLFNRIIEFTLVSYSQNTDLIMHGQETI